MKSILLISLFFLCLTHQSSFAEVSLSKQFTVSPAQLVELQNIFNRAKNRDTEMMEYLFIEVLPIENEYIAVICPPQTPLADDSGCFVTFKFNELISVKKPLLLGSTVEDILHQTNTTDPNTTEYHLHFNRLTDDESGTHYFCQPEGEAGSKLWGCYWYIHESIQ